MGNAARRRIIKSLVRTRMHRTQDPEECQTL
jgi:hypothetical protein